MYQKRVEQMRQVLQEQAVDMAAVTSPVMIYYLTGYYSDPHERFMALLIDARDGRCSLFVPGLDMEAARQVLDPDALIPVTDTEDPWQLVRKYAGTALKSLGVEKKSLSLFQAEKWLELFPDVQFWDVEPQLTSMRLKKSKDDIEIVRKAVEVVEEVLRRGVGKAAVGMTELEVTAELEYSMKILGADRPAFETTVLTGSRSALPHGRPGLHKIQRGDLLLFDLGVYVNGYCSDITRTFVVGEADAKQQEIYQVVLEANEKAVQAVRSGVPLSLIDQTAREHIEASGYGAYFTHRVGHGLGLEVHEAPSVHGRNSQLIEPGLLFTIEPGIYLPGFGGVRIEDDVYVTEEGTVEVLTTFPKTFTLIGGE